MNPECALTAPLGKTSKQPFSYNEVTYPSRSACFRALAATFGRTPDQIKDYFRRGLAIEDWPTR